MSTDISKKLFCILYQHTPDVRQSYSSHIRSLVREIREVFPKHGTCDECINSARPVDGKVCVTLMTLGPRTVGPGADESTCFCSDFEPKEQ